MNREIRGSRDVPVVVFLNAAIMICTALSANPLEPVRCLIPFLLTNLSNSALVKIEPISDTKTSGSRFFANTERSFSIVVCDVAEFTTIAFNHLAFDRASIVDVDAGP